VTDQSVSDEPSSGAPEALLFGCPVEERLGQDVVFASVDQYVALMKNLVDDGYDVCADLCGVDYFGHPGRSLPSGVEGQRFEVVVNLLDLRNARRLRVRVQVPEVPCELPSLFEIWPGTEAMEREAFDMFGVRFTNHPDLTRILMPEDWVGYPLRKDYAEGRIPVQFKGADH
jgi:NADH-quinone oxidoreductase subunit C